MTDATLEKPEETEGKNADSTESKELTAEQKADHDIVATAIANQFLDKANLAEALSTVSLGTLIQAAQNQAMIQANDTIKQMPTEDFDKLLNDIKNPTERSSKQSSKESSEESAKSE